MNFSKSASDIASKSAGWMMGTGCWCGGGGGTEEGTAAGDKRGALVPVLLGGSHDRGVTLSL